MLRKVYATLIIVLLSGTWAIAQNGTIKGKVLDKETREGVPFATIKVFKDGLMKSGTASDMEGQFHYFCLTNHQHWSYPWSLLATAKFPMQCTYAPNGSSPNATTPCPLNKQSRTKRSVFQTTWKVSVIISV